MKTSPNTNNLHYKKNHKPNGKFLTALEKKVFFPADLQFGIQAVDSGKLTFKQIEACRRTLRRSLGKLANIRIRVFPSVAVTSKPIASRMGKGKGAVSHWICPVKKGQVIFEIECSDSNKAILTLTKASTKLPVKTKIAYTYY